MEAALLIKQGGQSLQRQRIDRLLKRLRQLFLPMQEAQDFLGAQFEIKACRDIVHVGEAAKMQPTQPIVLKNLPNRDAKVVDRLGTLCRDAVCGLF